MIVCRRARASDAGRTDLNSLLRAGIASAGLSVEVDEPKLAQTCLALAREHYATVAEVDGFIVAYLGAQVYEHPWLHRCQLNVVGWYSKHPGAGIALARRCIRWARAQPNITTVSWWVNQQQAAQACKVLRSLARQDPMRSVGLVITV